MGNRAVSFRPHEQNTGGFEREETPVLYDYLIVK